jgi:hypothetical protein
VFGLIVGVAIAETLVRSGRWMPPRQMVHGRGLHSIDGVPVWEDATDRYNRVCIDSHPERTRILFFGSSITFGIGLTAEETFTTALEAQLNQVRPTPGFCVLNFAQPGFSFEQKYAVARIEVARYKPALIMWENWTEWADYRLIGDTAYGVGNLRVRDDGFVGLRGVPDGLNRLLFLHSRLYQYVVLLFGEPVPPGQEQGVTEFVNERLSQVPLLAESVGAKLVMYPAPPLDKPFSDTAAVLPDWHARLLEFAEARGIPAYPLQRELIDQDYLELRMDPCCHLSAAGHRALVPIMARIILGQLDARPSDANRRGARSARKTVDVAERSSVDAAATRVESVRQPR